jgi:hypothetical protein
MIILLDVFNQILCAGKGIATHSLNHDSAREASGESGTVGLAPDW